MARNEIISCLLTIFLGFLVKARKHKHKLHISIRVLGVIRATVLRKSINKNISTQKETTTFSSFFIHVSVCKSSPILQGNQNLSNFV